MRAALLLFFYSLLLFSRAQSLKTDLAYKVKSPKYIGVKTPVLVMLHGYGSDENDLFSLAGSMDSSFLIFSLRAPYPVNQQGYCWYALDFLKERKFRHNYQQMKESRLKLTSFISSACKAYKADSSQVFVMGFSQGAIMCYDLAFNAPEKVKGIVALSGYLTDETRKAVIDKEKLKHVNFFIAHGTMDAVIDFKAAEEAIDFFKKKELNFSFHSYQMPHAINAQELSDIQSWLRPQIGQAKNKQEKK